MSGVEVGLQTTPVENVRMSKPTPPVPLSTRDCSLRSRRTTH